MVKDDLKDRLLREGVVTIDRLNEVLREQEKTREPLIDALIRTGNFDEKNLVNLIKTFGYGTVNPTVFVIDDFVKKYIPQRLAEKYLAVPLSVYEEVLSVAFANPMNVRAIDEIRSVSGMRIKALVAEVGLIRKSIQKTYIEQKQGGSPQSLLTGSTEESASPAGLDDLVKMMEAEQQESGGGQTEDLMRSAYETPIIKLVNMILTEGIRRKASDIFIEPWESHVRVRVRVDGLLEEILRTHKSAAASIVSRVKILSELDIAERRMPQDGRFKIKISNKEVDMRVSVLPTVHGEKICLRILDTGNQAHDITKLGFTENEQEIIRDSARKPHGMLLVTGPTGSGKTTTLYSVLRYLDKPQVNITTVEDPVEYQLTGINQVNVRENIGLTFPAALRSILRQDPDIVLIGEIRDRETLDIAVKAALTGHLVLSTLHTNDAASTITRMMNMGLEPFLISSTVLMISAQRLIRRLCNRCKVQYDPEPGLLESLGIKASDKITFYRGRGCGQCRQSGYKGRTVITEMLEMNTQVRDLIMKGGSAEQIKNLGRTMGLGTLRESAMRKAIAGETTLEEVIRVTSEDGADDEAEPTEEDKKAAHHPPQGKEKAA